MPNTMPKVGRRLILFLSLESPEEMDRVFQASVATA